MKKRIALLTAAILIFSLLCTACTATPGGKAKLDPKNPVTLEIWHYYNGPQKTAFDGLVTQFNETVGMEEGIIVEAFSQGNIQALSEKIADSANGKAGADALPDIFATYADAAYSVDKLGLLTDLSPYFTKKELEAYRPEFLAEGRFSADGTLKIFPVAKSVELMMVNRTDWEKFSAASGAQLSDLATMEGVVRAAEAYYLWSGGKALFGRDAMANYMIIGCRQLGLELFRLDETGVSIHTDKKVFRKLWDNYYVPFIHGWYSANGRFRSDEANLGDIIALVGSSAATSYFPSVVSLNDVESYPIDSVILPAPIFEGGERYAVQQGAGMSVVKSNAQSEYASALFLKWFTETPQNLAFSAASGGYLPVKNDALDLARLDEALKATGSSGSDFDCMHQTFSAALEELGSCTMYTPPPSDGGLEARHLLETTLNDLAKADRQAILDLIAAGTDPAEAVAQFNTDEHFSAWFAQLDAALVQTNSAA